MVAGHLQEKNNFYYIVLSTRMKPEARTKWNQRAFRQEKQKEAEAHFAGTSEELYAPQSL